MTIPIAYNQITDLSASRVVGKGLSKAASAVPAAKGSGYVVGEVLTLSGGTAVQAAKFKVDSVSQAGAVQSVSLYTGTQASRGLAPQSGAYTVKPTNAVTTSSAGSGTGCTLTLTWSDDAIPDGTKMVLLQAEADDVRWRDDGVAPTATVGVLLKNGDSVFYEFSALSGLRFITASSGGILNVTFYA